MTIRDRIIEYLRLHPEGADDDELAKRLNLKARQQANARCRQLTTEGLVRREIVGGKLTNFLRTDDDTQPPQTASSPSNEGPVQPWFWEGYVQEAVVNHLKSLGFSIKKTANTATKEPGKDIEAERGGHPVWITVKGYPKGTPKTAAPTQARHWFSQATFDIVGWRTESEHADLAIALPDFPTYRKLSPRLEWLRQAVGLAIFWVREDGSVQIEGILHATS